MSLGLKTNLNRAQLQRFERILSTVKGSVLVNKTRLHQRFGIIALQWVDRNFRAKGALTGSPWKKLSLNTIAGRRKKSSVPLQDTGQLRGSFVANASSKSVRVGTEKQYASFHEEGTDPFTIVPKKGKFLAFPVAEGGSVVKRSFSSLATRKTFRKGQRIAFAKKVNHPGIPKRKILPTKSQILPSLVSAGNKFIEQVIKKAGG